MGEGLKRVEEVVRRMLSGVGSVRASEDAPRQKQLEDDFTTAMSTDKERKEAKKKKKKKKAKKKKWYSK